MTGPKEAKILLIEAGGEHSLASLLKQARISGNVIHFTDGNRALDYLFYTGAWSGKYFDPPRLILADLTLPSCPGPELLRQIKTDERTRLIPFTALVPAADDPSVAASRNWGVNAVLSRPYSFSTFARAMINMSMYWVLPELPSGQA